MKKVLILILLAAILLTACGQDKENDQGVVYVNITAEEAKQIMDSEEGCIILDVRTQEEYDQGHIPGAVLISNTEIEARAEEILTAKHPRSSFRRTERILADSRYIRPVSYAQFLQIHDFIRILLRGQKCADSAVAQLLIEVFRCCPAQTICDGCNATGEDDVQFSPGCETRKCVMDRDLEHCGYCDSYPCTIFPAEPSAEVLHQKIDIEKQWTWEDEKLMEAYTCQKNLDAFRREKHGL